MPIKFFKSILLPTVLLFSILSINAYALNTVNTATQRYKHNQDCLSAISSSLEVKYTAEENNMLPKLHSTLLHETMAFHPEPEYSEEYYDETLRNISNREFKKIHGYTKGPVNYNITTSSAALSSAYAHDQGTLYCNDWGLQVHCYFDDSVACCDRINSACVMTGIYGSVPLGVDGASLIADHNTQSGNTWYNARPNQLLYAKTPHGQFVYRVVRTGIATCDGYNLIMNDDGLDVLHSFMPSFNGLVMYTCYPRYQKTVTSQRWVVFAEKIKGTHLS